MKLIKRVIPILSALVILAAMILVPVSAAEDVASDVNYLVSDLYLFESSEGERELTVPSCYFSNQEYICFYWDYVGELSGKIYVSLYFTNLSGYADVVLGGTNADHRGRFLSVSDDGCVYYYEFEVETEYVTNLYLEVYFSQPNSTTMSILSLSSQGYTRVNKTNGYISVYKYIMSADPAAATRVEVVPFTTFDFPYEGYIRSDLSLGGIDIRCNVGSPDRPYEFLNFIVVSPSPNAEFSVGIIDQWTTDGTDIPYEVVPVEIHQFETQAIKNEDIQTALIAYYIKCDLRNVDFVSKNCVLKCWFPAENLSEGVNVAQGRIVSCWYDLPISVTPWYQITYNWLNDSMRRYTDMLIDAISNGVALPDWLKNKLTNAAQDQSDENLDIADKRNEVESSIQSTEDFFNHNPVQGIFDVPEFDIGSMVPSTWIPSSSITMMTSVMSAITNNNWITPILVIVFSLVMIAWLIFDHR